MTPHYSDTERLKRIAAEYAGKGFLLGGVMTPVSPQLQDLLERGRQIRNAMLWKEPTLSGAVNVYQQLASSREWTVSGKPKPAARAVEFLHATRSPDVETGMYVVGFEEFLKRRALDNIAVGMTTFLNRPQPGQRITRMEYLDPTLLLFSRERQVSTEVLPAERVWMYEGERFRYDQVHRTHAMPLGSQGVFISPLEPVMPDLQLAYLIREHDTAALDGRRVRDVVLVSDDAAQEVISNAILTQVAMWAGVDTGQVSIPIAALNTPSGVKVEDSIYLLSLSRLPEEFNREEFMFSYVNKISSALGLALRHFWNNEKTTNKALEEIQEQRQQQKGPAEFVKSEERLINQSGILNQFGGKVRFGFIEEVDAQSQLTNAQVLKATTEALGQIAQVFQAGLSLDALLGWMQSIRVLPPELELVDAPDDQQRLVSPDQQGLNPGETTVSGTPSPSALRDEKPKKVLKFKAKPLLEGEVTLNSMGEIVDHCYRVYPVAERIAEDAQKEATETDMEIVFEDMILEVQASLIDTARQKQLLGTLNLEAAGRFYSGQAIAKALEHLEQEVVEADDYPVLEALVDELEA